MNFKKIVGVVMMLAVAAFVMQARFASASYQVEQVVSGINVPWAMAWLPNGDMLVTERQGEIFRVRNGEIIAKLSGLPDIRAGGQGGLLDLVPHPDFADNQLLYFSFSDPTGGQGSNTAIARAKLEGDALTAVEVLYKATPNTTNGRHFGSRIAFDQAGFLYFSVGDRGDRDTNPQNKQRDGGKVYRLSANGEVPPDNPFVAETNAISAMYSLGHRNIQGMAMNPATGQIWAHEHGPRGGDELNRIEAGKNFGWPILSYGINYSGTSFAEGTERAGYESPDWYWVPSIAPSGMAFVTSANYPEWQGHVLVGSLKFGQLVLCELEGDRVVSASPVIEQLGRVRDVRQGPDGYIYLAIDGVGIKRIRPLGEGE